MNPIFTDGSQTPRRLGLEVVETRNSRVRRALSSAYAAVVSGLAIGVIGALGFAADQPWLFPSLGPTVFLQTVTPTAQSARIWNTIVGHAIRLVAGFAALFLFGAQNMPAAMSAEILSLQRMAATTLAVVVTVGLQSVLNALHPPAAATTMLITLGGLKPSWNTVFIVAAGVLLSSAFGVIVRLFHPGAFFQKNGARCVHGAE